jgi:hypothetical protein
MLGRDIRKVYPQLEHVKIEEAWAGLMSYAVHKMPLIGEVMPGVWIAGGFGGHGINTSAMAGDLIASAMVDGDDRWRLFSSYELVWTGGAWGRVGAQVLFWAKRIQDGVAERLSRHRERARRREAEQAARATVERERREAEAETRRAVEAAARELAEENVERFAAAQRVAEVAPQTGGNGHGAQDADYAPARNMESAGPPPTYREPEPSRQAERALEAASAPAGQVRSARRRAAKPRRRAARPRRRAARPAGSSSRGAFASTPARRC